MRNGATCCEGGNGDDGGGALQAAVPNFVAQFTQNSDYIGLISFASDARVDVPITNQFVTPIDTAIGGMIFDGGTFGTGAGSNTYDTAHGPPMSLADHQNTTTAAGLPAGTPYTKVMVYFTDGLMNTIQDTFACTNNGLGNQVFNYGGYDSGTGYDFMDPLGNFRGTTDIYMNDDYSAVYGCGGSPACNCTSGSSGGCNGSCGTGDRLPKHPTCNGANNNEIPTSVSPNYCAYANKRILPLAANWGMEGTESCQHHCRSTVPGHFHGQHHAAGDSGGDILLCHRVGWLRHHECRDPDFPGNHR